MTNLICKMCRRRFSVYTVFRSDGAVRSCCSYDCRDRLKEKQAKLRRAGWFKQAAKRKRCVLWPLGKARGYGKATVLGCTKLAHILAWEHFNGSVPDGLIIRHKCDTRACINVNHLELGTYADNSQDMVKRGRASTGERNSNTKLTWRKVRAIRASDARPVDLARKYQVSYQVIWRIKSDRGWREPTSNLSV